MSKCKVVDLNGMTSEQQKIEMEKHARGSTGSGTPQVKNVAPPPSQSAAIQLNEVEAGFGSLSKGFLNNTDFSLSGNSGIPDPKGNRPDGKDVLFESLIEGIDPDYANASQPVVENDETFDSLGAIAKLLAGDPTQPAPRHSLGEEQDVKLATPVRGIENDEVREQAKLLSSTVKHKMTIHPPASPGDKTTARISVDLKGNSDTLKEVDLEVGEREVRIRVRETLLALSLPFVANPNTTKAKFLKSKSSLNITVYEL